MRSSILLFIVASVILYGCIEVYEPEISADNQHFVVEGLLTDEAGPHIVRLSRSNTFGEEIRQNYVGRANVRIIDSQNNAVDLREIRSGYYETPEDFSGTIGETYTLHIETVEGVVYESEPQEMVKPVSIDSLYGEFGQQTFSFESPASGDIYQRRVEGVNMYFDVSRNDEQIPKFRFNTVLMLQYEWAVAVGGAPIYDLCWVKRRIVDFLEADIPQNLSKPDIPRNRIAFLPISGRNMRYMGFPQYGRDDSTAISYTHPRIVIKSIYTLNEEAYEFHYDRNMQLSDEGSFFDPISPQLSGNIYNVDDENEIVFGFFEVSPVTKSTINVRIDENQNIIQIDTLDCLEYVPNSGCLTAEFPEWWI